MSETSIQKIPDHITFQKKSFHPGSFAEQFNDMKDRSSLNYILLLRENKDLDKREEIFNKTKSKRSFISKLNNPLTKLGIFILFIIMTLAVFPSWISTYNHNQVAQGVYDNYYQAPTALHPLGTSNFGRDVLGRLIWGTRTSLTIGLIAIIISCILGVLVGVYAAYQGGWVDNLIMRLVDIIMAFPGLILVIIVVSIFGAKMQNILLVYGFLGIPGYSRLVRGSALQEKNRTYVEAAKVSGAKDWSIMFKHILPNCLAPIIVSFTFDIGGIILSLAGLSFLGFGDSSIVEWGYDINQGRRHLGDAPWSAIWPGVGILFTVLGFMLLGDGLRDALDPRLQAKH